MPMFWIILVIAMHFVGSYTVLTTLYRLLCISWPRNTVFR